MRDQYTPTPRDTATCPHCGEIVPGAPAARFPHLLTAALTWRCPRCGGRWHVVHELAADQPITRLWDPVEAPPA